MPWTREVKIFCIITYLETKSFKTVQAKICGKSNFNNYLQKSQIYRWVHKFQATRSVNNLNMKEENPRFCRKLTARWPDNLDAVRDSVRRSPKKFLQRHSKNLVFNVHCKNKSISFFPSEVMIAFQDVVARIVDAIWIIISMGCNLFWDTQYAIKQRNWTEPSTSLDINKLESFVIELTLITVLMHINKELITKLHFHLAHP